jgi:hypothetical protein
MPEKRAKFNVAMQRRLDFIVQRIIYEGVDGGDAVRNHNQLRRKPMYQAFETVQKAAKDNFDIAMKNFGTTTKGVQAITAETTDYTKKAFESNSAAVEKLVGVKSVEKALELQAEYAKSTYEGFVAFATKVGTMYTDLAKETIKPVESAISKISK